MSDLISITEVSRRSGVASSALRFYEERGLVKSERAGSGHRRYPRAALRRVAFIVFAQKMGLTLEEIGAELAKLPDNRVPQRSDWARISGSWTRRIDERNRRAAAPSCGADPLHRLWLPVAEAMPSWRTRQIGPTGSAPARVT